MPKRASRRMPFMQFFCADWLADSAVRSAKPATRGIWFDALCRMWANGQTGVLAKPKDTLCALLSCTIPELEAALSEIQRHNIGEVRICNDEVTLINRRMQREHRQRLLTNARVAGYRRSHKSNAVESIDHNHNQISDLISLAKDAENALPPNFPKSEDSAWATAQQIPKIEREFVILVWNRAMFRAGCDAKGNPIRSWPHFVATEWYYEQERRKKRPLRSQRRPEAASSAEQIAPRIS